MHFLSLTAFLLLPFIGSVTFGQAGHNGIQARTEVQLMNGFGRVEVKNDKFEIRGEISSTSDTSFVVLSQTINIDPAQVFEFKQKGILKVGEKVKVEGIIKDGKKFAEEINIIGTGQGRFKFNYHNLTPTVIPAATPTPAPTSTSSPTSSPTPAITVTPTPTVGSNSRVEVETFLKQILDLLKNLL